MIMLLPPLQLWSASVEAWERPTSRLLLIAEGFESRTTEWLRSLPNLPQFADAVIFRYQPEKKSRLSELLDEVRPRTQREPVLMEYNRFDSAESEMEFSQKLPKLLLGKTEIALDISVMSKLLIMILLYLLRNWSGALRIIYTEPLSYAPTFDEYQSHRKQLRSAVVLPSFGVHQVIRTPALASTVMQRSPSLVIAFTSFNEQLVRALLSSVNPSRMLLINGRPPRLAWREQAMLEIHRSIIEEFSDDNVLRGDTLQRTTSTLDYRETFSLLVKEYGENCYSHRVIVAPTGSKMQAVGASLFKIAAPDVHIEYPTPESFFIEGYSSAEIAAIHTVTFANYSRFLDNLKVHTGPSDWKGRKRRGGRITPT